MPTVHLLIGLPGAGKSSWVREHLARCAAHGIAAPTVASTDAVLVEWGAAHGLDYRESFARFDFADVERELSRRVDAAIASGADVVWDQTNVVAAARRRKLARFPPAYRRIGVWLDAPLSVIRDRLRSPGRVAQGKRIGEGVLAEMLRQLEPPRAEEFDLLLVRRYGAASRPGAGALAWPADGLRREGQGEGEGGALARGARD